MKGKETNNNVIEMDPDLEFIDIDHKGETPVIDVTGKNRTALIVMMIFVAAVMLTITLLLGGCSNTKETANSDNPEPTTEDVIEIPTPPAEEVTAQPEVTQPDEPDPELAEPELEGIEAVISYARTLDCLGDNCLIYYDSTTKQGTVLEDGQEISPKVGDYILTIGSTFKGTYFIPGLEYNLDYYLEEYFIICPINEEFVNSDVITAGIIDIDENCTKYEFTVAGQDNGDDKETTPTRYDEFLKYTDRTEVCIVVTDMDYMLKDIILEDGDSYTLAEDELLYLYLPKEATSFSTTSEDAEIFDNGSGYIFLYVSFGTNMKIPISIEYADGTTEEITIYITR